MMPAGTRYGDLALVWRLMAEARPHWGHMTAIFLLGLLGTPLALLTPVPLKIVVDSVIGAEPLPGFLAPVVPPAVPNTTSGMLWLVAALVVGISLLTYLQVLAMWLLQTYTGEKMVLGFRAKLFRHVQDLSLGYHDRTGTADSLYRIQYDANAIQNFAILGVMPFASSLVAIAAMIYITAVINWQLALVALAVCPVLFLLTGMSRGRIRTGWSALKEIESAALAVIQEALGALRVVKAFGREAHEAARFRACSRRIVWGQVRLALIEGGFDLFVGMTTALGTAAVLVLGVLHVRAGTLTLGELLLVMSYLGQLYRPLETVSRKVAELQSSLASAERVFALLDQAPSIAERPDARPLARAAGRVSFRGVWFGYDRDPEVIRDVSFDVPPGSRVGIFGTTGAGKTTLISLLIRFYDPTHGEILLDGVDLRDYRLADLRRQFAVVLQEPVLFSASIAENIAYGGDGASEAEIVAAARAANAHDFILHLPEGYMTQVGERGMRLSGGERQRIALARAFLRDAPILILDEPTSSVDVATEAGILEAMNRLMEGRTTFMITHRVYGLAGFNRRFRIEGGRLAEVPANVPLAG